MTTKARYRVLGAVVAAVVAAVVGCFFLSMGSGYESSLPADAQALARLDAKALLEKTSLSLVKQRQGELEHSGIDFAHSLYAFVDGRGGPGVLLPLRSARDFKAYLQGKGIEVERQRGYSWARSGQWLMAFSDDRCLAFGPLSEQEMGAMRGQMASLMGQSGKPKAALLGRVEKSRAPLSAAFDVGRAQRLLARVLPEVSGVFHGGLTGTVGMDVDFKEQRIVADVTLYGTGVEEGKSFLVPLDEPASLPKSADGMCVLTVGVDGDALLALLRSYPAVRTALLAINFTFDLDQMIRAIQGGVSLSVVRDAWETPQITLTTRFKDTHFRQSLEGLTDLYYPMAEGGVEVHDDSTFCVGFPDGYLYLGLRGNRLAACTDQVCGEAAVKDLEEGRLVSMKDAVGNLVYMQLDLTTLPECHWMWEPLARHGVDMGKFLRQYGKLILRVRAEKDEREND